MGWYLQPPPPSPPPPPQAERDALRADLDGLLAQRQALEGMKAVVVKALAGGLPQVRVGVCVRASR